MPVTRRTRFEVLRRDGNRCRYCGATSDEARMTVDHVLPVALGGGDDPSNLVAACVDCNAGKTSTGPGEHLVAQVSDDAVRWAQAMKAAAAEVATQADALRTAVELVRGEWIAQAAYPSREYLPDDHASLIARILGAGLPVEVMLDMVRVAQTTKLISNRWSYFAGCCWKQVARLQERARELAADVRSVEDDDEDAEGAYRRGRQDGERAGVAELLDQIAPSVILERFIDGEQHRIPDRFKLADKAA